MFCIFHDWEELEINNKHYRRCSKCGKCQMYEELIWDAFWMNVKELPADVKDFIIGKTLKEIALDLAYKRYSIYDLPNIIKNELEVGGYHNMEEFKKIRKEMKNNELRKLGVKIENNKI